MDEKENHGEQGEWRLESEGRDPKRERSGNEKNDDRKEEWYVFVHVRT